MKTMNRCALAALALVGTSAAFAQSSVTLYGRVNTTFEHQKDGDVGSVRISVCEAVESVTQS